MRKGVWHMNYIVLDLEWNHPKIYAKDRIAELPFEIIEIGAVKVDGDRLEVLVPVILLVN